MRTRAGVIAHRRKRDPRDAVAVYVDSGFDGDTCSLNVVYTQEAKDEVAKVLSSRAYYVGVNGKMNFSAANDTINYVLASMTS